MVTVLYMFFGTNQWLFNLSVYYLAYDAASDVQRTHHVNIKLSETPVFFQNHTSLTNCLMEHDWNYDTCSLNIICFCLKHSLFFNSVVYGIAKFQDLGHHISSFCRFFLASVEEACDFGVVGNCSLPYVFGQKYGVGECVSSILVAEHPCCISETLQMGEPHMTLRLVSEDVLFFRSLNCNCVAYCTFEACTHYITCKTVKHVKL